MDGRASVSRLRRIGASALLLAGTPFAWADDCDPCGPYRFEGKYLHETWDVAQGGLARGVSHLEKMDLAFELDGERAFGLPALTLFARVIYDNAGSVSADLTGDAQGVSNIEAIAATRLFELWSEWSPGADGSLRVGLYDFNSEFDVNATGALFINPSHGIGKDISQSGRAGPSVFPVTSLGARVRWSIAPAWSVQVAALDGVPGDPDRPKRTTVQFDSQDGALLAAEVDRRGERLRKLAVGAWHYTGHFDRFADSADMTDTSRSHGTSGAYALAEMQLWSPDSSSDRGLATFLRFGVADRQVQRFAQYFGTGLVYTGLLMKDDQLGLALARATNASPYRREQSLADVPADRSETNLELTWRFSVRDWLSVQPDLQYIFNPNTDPTSADGLALGLRVEISLKRP